MITLNDFQALPFDKKCDFITVFADYLVYDEKDNCKNYLYHMDRFFVEVSYSPLENRVVGIIAFDNPNRLDCYLESVDISDMHNVY